MSYSYLGYDDAYDVDLLLQYLLTLICFWSSCVFHEGGSIGIVFDEGEEEDTVVIDEIKKGTPAARRYGGCNGFCIQMMKIEFKMMDLH